MSDILINAVANLEEDKALALVREKIEAGETAFEIVDQCRKGVEIVGQRYNEGAYYLSDLIMSEAIFKEVMEIIEPFFPVNLESYIESDAPQIIIGTIEGDIHDMGKNIVIYLLRAAGYRVIDLGVDVHAEEFVGAVKETGAKIIGICVVLNYCIGSIKKVVDLLMETGLREGVKVIIGGYPVDIHAQEYTGADYYSNDAVKALEIFDSIYNIKRSKKGV